MKKPIRITLYVLLIVVLVSAYPVYAIVVYQTSKSPDDLSKFPKEGVYVCDRGDYSITIDLSGDNPDSAVGARSIVLQNGEHTYELECYEMHGHGTLCVPVSPQAILAFRSVDSGADTYIHFAASKYKFHADDFYLLSISVYENNTFRPLKNKTDLHFVRVAA